MSPSYCKDPRSLHMPAVLLDVSSTTQAAKLRVVTFENARHGGLRVAERVAALRSQVPDGVSDAVSLGHLGWQQQWAQRSFLENLGTAAAVLERRNSTVSEAARALPKRVGWQGQGVGSWQRLSTVDRVRFLDLFYNLVDRLYS